MRSALFCIVLVIAETCAGTAVTSFRSFQLQHNKVYESNAELSQREKIFNSNVRKINQHNKLFDQGLTTYRMGINKYADMTPEEFSSMLKTLPLSNVSMKQDANAGSVEYDESKLPASIDWRNKKVVGAVKDQQKCGSCWAFSATGTLEAQLAINEQTLVTLSEQNLIDCVTNNAGCDGGTVQEAYNYIMNNGLPYEEDYPYTGQENSRCKDVKGKAVTLKSYKNISPYNETELILAVGLVGPVSVAINAEQMQYYKSGIFDSYCSNAVNHAVLAVGYTTSSEGKPYWILKNSWGSEWGEDGYFRIALGKGLCGIAKQACYPVGTASGSSKVHFFNVSVASLISGIIYVILNR